MRAIANLPCNTSNDRISYDVGADIVEPAVKRLLDERESLRRKRMALDRQIVALDVALGVLGVRVKDQRGDYTEVVEEHYAKDQPFKNLSLAAACLMALRDHADLLLDKNKVEYLLTLGGYQFEAKDPTNSVEITLRKLAAEGKCKAIKRPGPHGTLYQSTGFREPKEDSVNEGKTG